LLVIHAMSLEKRIAGTVEVEMALVSKGQKGRMHA
jgi:hypothetical protein